MVSTVVLALSSSSIIIPMFVANPKLQDSDKVMGTVTVVLFWLAVIVLKLLLG